MWDMSALIRRCENFGLFYSFCSQLAVDAESQARDQDVRRHVDIRTNPFLKACFYCEEATEVFLTPTAKRNALGAIWRNASMPFF